MTSDDKRPTAHAEIEVPGSPEQVWRAIATSKGTAAWMFATQIQPREGGAVAIHREPFGHDATATVNVSGRLYGPNAATVAEREHPRWNAWLSECFPTPAGHRAQTT